MLDYGAKGEVEAQDHLRLRRRRRRRARAGKLFGREAEWGVEPGALDGTREFVATYRDPGVPGRRSPTPPAPATSTSDFEMVQDTFRRFAEDEDRARSPSTSTARTPTSPRSIITGLAEIGGFGLSVPEEYDGYAEGGESEYIGMVVATEELSRGSLGAGGSLITRPEILTRALAGRRHRGAEAASGCPSWPPAEVMAAVAVTEPDYGSDVAGVKVTATPTEGGWLINGVKTWCTFGARADVLMLLARTDPDRVHRPTGACRCSSCPSRAATATASRSPRSGPTAAPGGGKMEGRAIDTIGYRGMHSYEVAFDNWFVAAENLIGGEDGLGRGFYYQMAGFENGRLQTAARAVGVMQAAYEAARQYAARPRRVRPARSPSYQLTQAKLGRMAVAHPGRAASSPTRSPG